MSYIRCLSNPEGLYIWGDGKYVNITGNKTKGIYLIPQKTFDGLLKKYVGSYRDNCKYRGASIEEIKIPRKTTKSEKTLEKLLNTKFGDFKMRLSYKNWHIDMWLVTWMYICRRAERNKK